MPGASAGAGGHQPPVHVAPFAAVALIAVFIVLAGCATTPTGGDGSSSVPPTTRGPTPSATPSSAASPSSAPSDAATPDVPDAADPADTPEEALAAVIAAFPEFEGYALQDLGGEMIIGGSTSVLAAETEDGIRLDFMTGSGDCMAGCINRSFDAFLVAPDGTVTELCSWREQGGEIASGKRC